MPLLDEVDALIDHRHLLTHSFYTRWVAGTLPREAIVEYARQYFAFESSFPRFLSAVHSRCEDPGARQAILENLWDEEHGEENHRELWLRFAEGIGVPREDVAGAKRNDATRALVETYAELSEEPAAGLAAIHARPASTCSIPRRSRASESTTASTTIARSRSGASTRASTLRTRTPSARSWPARIGSRWWKARAGPWTRGGRSSTRWTSPRSRFAYHSAVPIYEYRCVDCDRFFDRLAAYDAASPACPSCGGDDVRRLISLIGGLGGSTETSAPSAAGGCGGCAGGSHACACAN